MGQSQVVSNTCRLLFVLIGFFVTEGLLAQTKQVRHLSLNEGLSNVYVLDIVQDSSGAIWFATELGLNRYVAGRFTTFYKSELEDGRSVNSNEINDLLYDPEAHKLYVATKSSGLNVLDLRSGMFSYYRHDPDNPRSIATDDVTALTLGKDGKIWMGTYHQGVQMFDPMSGEFTRFNTSSIPDFPSNSVWSLDQDPDGLLYIGHVDHGLTILDPKTRKFEHITKQTSQGRLPHDEVKVVYRDPDGRIWLGTREGLAVYDRARSKVTKIPFLGRTNVFVSAIKVHQGKVWIGTDSPQLYEVSLADMKSNPLATARPVSHLRLPLKDYVSIQRIETDRYGNVWFGTYGAGALVLPHVQPFFGTLSLPADISDSPINSLLFDHNKDGWLVTDGDGIVKRKSDGVFEKIPLPWVDSESSVHLMSAFLDGNGRIWIGSRHGGVGMYDSASRRWKVYTETGLDEVRAMAQDKSGKIWIGAYGGVFIYDPKTSTFERFKVNNSPLGDYGARALLCDEEGNMWVGTYGQGIFVYGPNRKVIKKVSTANGLSSNTINHLIKDRYGDVWVATNEGIARCLKDDNYALSATKQVDRPNGWEIILSLAEDNEGNIWAATNKGVVSYDRAKDRYAFYDQSFGVPVGEFTARSVAVSPDGSIYFGAIGKVCAVLGGVGDAHWPPVPRVHFGSLNVIKQTQSEGTEQTLHPLSEAGISLHHDQNHFHIDFGVSDFALSGLVEYSYQLVGLDRGWNFIGDEQSIHFRDVPYGKYELRLRAKYKNGDWDNAYISMPIMIAPPLYLSKVAIFMYAMLALGLVYVIAYFYARKVKLEGELRLKKAEQAQMDKLYTERLNFFTNVTHELRTPLTLILGPLDDLLRAKGLSTKQEAWIRTIQQSAGRLFDLVNQLLEFRKLESQHKQLVLETGRLGDLVKEVAQKYIELNTNPALRISVVLPHDEQKIRFDADILHLVLDNLLSNAYKNTRKGEIIIELRYEKEAIAQWAVISVKDTGRGMPEAYHERVFDRFFQIPDGSGVGGTGLGLSIVRDLVALHHGQVSVSSIPGQGSDFVLRLPVQVIDTVPKNLACPTDGDQDDELLVLLVEDDTALRRYLAESLRERYRVVEASGGHEAVKLAAELVPDIMVSDIMMEDGDGYDMIDKLKNQQATSHIPIIFLTAKDTNEDRQKGYRLGVDSYLVKPVTPAVLFERIQNILHRLKETHQGIQLKKNVAAQNDLAEKKQDYLWKENDFVAKLVELIETHMQEDVLDAHLLAERMNMSHSTLYRKLKAITGKNINQFVRKVRMHKAAELLKTGEYNVTEVSFMVGINSAIYFRQCFREEFGQLPSEFQKSHSQTILE